MDWVGNGCLVKEQRSENISRCVLEEGWLLGSFENSSLWGSSSGPKMLSVVRNEGSGACWALAATSPEVTSLQGEAGPKVRPSP